MTEKGGAVAQGDAEARPRRRWPCPIRIDYNVAMAREWDKILREGVYEDGKPITEKGADSAIDIIYLHLEHAEKDLQIHPERGEKYVDTLRELRSKYPLSEESDTPQK